MSMQHLIGRLEEAAKGLDVKRIAKLTDQNYHTVAIAEAAQSESRLAILSRMIEDDGQ